MAWSKLSDDFSDDCWRLSDQAFRLHVEGLVWNGRKLLDCRIPKEDLRRFAKNDAAVAELVSKEFWEDDGDAYLIVHHAIYQRSREAVINQQRANRRNGKKGGRPKGPGRESIEKMVGDSPVPAGEVIDPFTGEVTESVTQSVTETETERDRTGQVQERQLWDEETSTNSDEFPPGDPWHGQPSTYPLCGADGCKTRLTTDRLKAQGFCFNHKHLNVGAA